MSNGTSETEQIQIVRLQEVVKSLKEEVKELEKLVKEKEIWTREQVQRLYDKYDHEINMIKTQFNQLISELSKKKNGNSKSLVGAIIKLGLGL